MVIVSSCAVSSAPAADMAPALLNLYSLITDVLEGLASDSCALIHYSSWVKSAAKGIIFVVYTGRKHTQPVIRFFPSINFLHRDLQTSVCEVGIEILFWQFTHHHLSLISG